MKKKFLAGILAVLLVLTGCSVKISKPKTLENPSTEEIKKSTVLIWGTDLPEAERATLREHFKGETIVEYDITPEDYKEIFGREVSQGSLLSSVAVRYNEKGGVTAGILTPDNITEIKEHQYVNAAATAGLLDVDMRVISTRKVTGESALAGVFKAYKLMGEKVDAKKLEKAQEELSTVAEISVNLNEEDLSKLSDAILKTKERLSQAKAEGKEVNSETVMKEELDKSGVSISEEGKEKLNGVLENFSSSISEEDAKEFLSRAKSFSKSILEGGEKLFNKANDAGIFEGIWNWFKNLFN